MTHCLKSLRLKLKTATRTFVTACALLHAAPSFSAELWCQGTTNQIWTTAVGDVMLVPSFRGDHIKICNFDTAVNGISTKSCEQMLHTLRYATATGLQVLVKLQDTGTATCATLPTYHLTPAVYYVMLIR
jgi:hypothetical protein